MGRTDHCHGRIQDTPFCFVPTCKEPLHLLVSQKKVTTSFRILKLSTVFNLLVIAAKWFNPQVNCVTLAFGLNWLQPNNVSGIGVG